MGFGDPASAAVGQLDAELTVGYRGGVEKLEYLTHHGSSPVINGWTVGMQAFDYNLYALGPGTLDRDDWKITDPTHRIIERAIADRLGVWGDQRRRSRLRTGLQ